MQGQALAMVLERAPRSVETSASMVEREDLEQKRMPAGLAKKLSSSHKHRINRQFHSKYVINVNDNHLLT